MDHNISLSLTPGTSATFFVPTFAPGDSVQLFITSSISLDKLGLVINEYINGDNPLVGDVILFSDPTFSTYVCNSSSLVYEQRYNTSATFGSAVVMPQSGQYFVWQLTNSSGNTTSLSDFSGVVFASQ